MWRTVCAPGSEKFDELGDTLGTVAGGATAAGIPEPGIVELSCGLKTRLQQIRSSCVEATRKDTAQTKDGVGARPCLDPFLGFCVLRDDGKRSASYRGNTIGMGPQTG